MVIETAVSHAMELGKRRSKMESAEEWINQALEEAKSLPKSNKKRHMLIFTLEYALNSLDMDWPNNG